MYCQDYLVILLFFPYKLFHSSLQKKLMNKQMFATTEYTHNLHKSVDLCNTF